MSKRGGGEGADQLLYASSGQVGKGNHHRLSEPAHPASYRQYSVPVHGSKDHSLSESDPAMFTGGKAEGPAVFVNPYIDERVGRELHLFAELHDAFRLRNIEDETWKGP